MAPEQVSTNTAEGNRQSAQDEHHRMMTVQLRLAFLKEAFEALGSTRASEYEFSPSAFAGLAYIVEAVKNDVVMAQDFIEDNYLGRASHE